MKNRFLCFILLSIVSIAGLAFNESKLFVDEQGRFSFSFTGDWRKFDKKEDKVDGHFVIARSGRAVAEVIIAHETPKKKLTIDEYLENEKKRIEKNAGYTKINEEKNFKIGGCAAAWLLINVAEKDVSGKTAIKKLSQYFIQKEDSFWGITVMASEIDADIIAEVQQIMVKSFEFGTGGKVSLNPIAKEDTKTILDPDRRYSLRVPESWKLVETGGPELAIQSAVGMMYVFVLPLEGTDVKSAAHDFIIKHEQAEKSNVINDAPLKVGTEKGHLINYEVEKSGNLYHVQLAVVQREDFGFFLYFYASPKQWDENKALITGVQSTFAFLKMKVAGKGKTGLPEFLMPHAEISEVGTEISKEQDSETTSKAIGELLWEPFSKDNMPK
jgi:hypothetical protein